VFPQESIPADNQGMFLFFFVFMQIPNHPHAIPQACTSTPRRGRAWTASRPLPPPWPSSPTCRCRSRAWPTGGTSAARCWPARPRSTSRPTRASSWRTLPSWTTPRPTRPRPRPSPSGPSSSSSLAQSTLLPSATYLLSPVSSLLKNVTKTALHRRGPADPALGRLPRPARRHALQRPRRREPPCGL